MDKSSRYSLLLQKMKIMVQWNYVPGEKLAFLIQTKKYGYNLARISIPYISGEVVVLIV